MRSKNYRKKIIQHMGEYKRNFLGITEDGVYGKLKVRYEHILPMSIGQWETLEFNLLPTINMKNQILKEIKYHPYSHHLNSSQLMCINFFLPIIGEKLLLIILKQAIGIEFSDGTEIVDVSFEKIEPKKDNTNFDLYLQLTTGEKIYFEVKYTEQQFGGNCYKNGILKQKYNKKYENYYKEYLKSSLMDTKDKEEFFRDYQINRSLSYIKSSSEFVVFILPFNSEDLLKEVTSVVNRNTSINKQVKIVDWTNLCEIVQGKSVNTLLYQHFKLFKDKYIV